MSTRASWWGLVAVFLACWMTPGEARAWVETAVRRHEARVEVALDGSAVVRHQLVLKVRGGPMKSLEIGGMGTAIEPLPDASVRRAIEGSSSVWPLTASSLEDGSLRLKIGAERGIRGGSYLFTFAYSLDMNEMGWLEQRDDGVMVTWVGPRLSTGVDSAKVTFVTPRGSVAPELAAAESGAGASVLLGDVRRGAEFDEAELVRAHLAAGEPAIWRVLVAGGVFPDAPGLAEEKPTRTLSPQKRSLEGGVWGASTKLNAMVAGGLGLIYALLVVLKAMAVRTAARQAEARVKPLIPGGPWLRGVLSLGFCSSAAWFAMGHEPWIAVALGAGAVISTTYLLPVRLTRPRGPGVWDEVPTSAVEARQRLAGGVFDTRSLAGFALFAVLVGAVLAVAYRLLPVSNYLALMTVSWAALLVPLFWTGRRNDFPQPPVEQARPWLKYIKRALDPELAHAELWGRKATTSSAPGAESAYDETRLRIVLKRPPAGLRALEISLDEAAGACVMPCVVLRVLEDSPTLMQLPKDIPWQRGRSPEERVALLRPTAPTRAQLYRLVRSLIASLRGVQRSSSNPARSAGSGEVASKLPTPSTSPAM